MSTKVIYRHIFSSIFSNLINVCVFVYYTSFPNLDPRVENYPMIGSPFLIAAFVAIYVFFVTEWGPNFMKNRPAYDLKDVMKIYNLLQIIVNLFVGFYVSFHNFSR